jgi:hypothetical protein
MWDCVGLMLQIVDGQEEKLGTENNRLAIRLQLFKNRSFKE